MQDRHVELGAYDQQPCMYDLRNKMAEVMYYGSLNIAASGIATPEMSAQGPNSIVLPSLKLSSKLGRKLSCVFVVLKSW